MKKILEKPHLFFFALIPLFIIVGLLNINVPINITISYIYYLINVDFWCYISAVYCGLIGINYLSLNIIKKKPKKGLTFLHIVFQLLCIIPYFFAVFQLDENGYFPENSILNSSAFSTILVFCFLLFILSVFIHLINFFSSLLLKTD